MKTPDVGWINRNERVIAVFADTDEIEPLTRYLMNVGGVSCEDVRGETCKMLRVHVYSKFSIDKALRHIAGYENMRVYGLLADPTKPNLVRD